MNYKTLIKTMHFEGLSIKEICEKTNATEKEVKTVLKGIIDNKSGLENSVGSLIATIYPKHKVIEQWKVGNLYVDYYLPELRLAIEADGIQHYKANEFYHGKGVLASSAGLGKQISNDLTKNKSLKELHIYLIRIRYDTELTETNLRSIFNEHNAAIINNLEHYKNCNRILE